MPTNTAAASRIELPPPAWGSPAHQAKVRAEKEWVRYLRAHASQDSDQRKVGKQTRYVEDIDVVIRYTLPPVWPEEAASKFVTDDERWDLPEADDSLLIKILSAGYSPFFQRTGEFSKVRSYFCCILWRVRSRHNPALGRRSQANRNEFVNSPLASSRPLHFLLLNLVPQITQP